MATDFQTTTVRYDLCISSIDIEDFSNEGRISRQICLKVHNMLLFYTFHLKNMRYHGIEITSKVSFLSNLILTYIKLVALGSVRK